MVRPSGVKRPGGPLDRIGQPDRAAAGRRARIRSNDLCRSAGRYAVEHRAALWSDHRRSRPGQRPDQSELDLRRPAVDHSRFIRRPRPPRTPAGKPATVVNRLHTVQADETLFGIALKYGTTVRSLIETNRLDRAGFIVPGQQLIIPADARSNQAGVAQPTTPLPAPFTDIDIGPLPLYQGSVMEVTVRTSQPVSLTGQFGDRSIPFALDGDHYIGLVGVGAHPVSGVTPGLHSLVITATQDNAVADGGGVERRDSSRAISTRNTSASQPIGSSCSIRRWWPPNARNSMPRGACSIRSATGTASSACRSINSSGSVRRSAHAARMMAAR